MYTAFYGLRDKPFSLVPDPRFLFLAESHREALAHLLYGIDEGEGFIMVTGEVGTGKTTLCRTLLQRLGSASEVAFIFNPTLSALELLQSVNSELGLPTAGRSLRDLHEQLNSFLIEKKREGRRVLIIIDEAQALEVGTLEQVRLLSNLETETQKLVQIVLIGQPELEAKLEQPELRQLRQRISVHWRLAPLTAAETRSYVRHRLRIAARAERELFTETALREVHRRTRGVPRLVNILCDRALLAGYAVRSKEIGLGLVGRAQRELAVGGAPRTRRPGRRSWLGRRRAALAAALLVLGMGAGFAWQRAAGPVDLVDLQDWLGVDLGLETTAARDEAPAPVSSAPPDAAAPPGPSTPSTPSTPSGPSSASEVAPAEPAAALSADDELSWWLGDVPPDVTVEAAVLSLFPAWQGAGGVPRVLPLSHADFTTLRLLNHPSVLRLISDDGTSHLVLLRQLHDGRATLESVAPDAGMLEVAAEAVKRRWTGEAHVVWRDFESLPPVLNRGDSGPSVAWVQSSLALLGHYPYEPTGRFDPATVRAVQSFQRDHRLRADGEVGPVTKMVLYDALPAYPVPRLAGDERARADVG